MESCLTNRLSRFIDLTEGERDFVRYMEDDESEMSRRAAIVTIGDRVDHLWVLKFGWVIARSRDSRGRSSILRIYLPGEVMGLAEIGKGTAVHSLEMLTDGCVCPFPRGAVAEMYDKAPRLAALLTSIGSLDQLDLRERVFQLARLSAVERVSHFLLTLQDRLALANSGRSRRFHLPLTNAQIGDYLGLTDIYIGRVLKDLVADGRIVVEKRHVTINDADAWAEEVGYRNIFDRIDTSWFPDPTERGR